MHYNLLLAEPIIAHDKLNIRGLNHSKFEF